MVCGQGITVSDREAHWWAVYLRQFFRYARTRDDRLEAAPLVGAYLESLEARLPKEQQWQAEKARHVLEIFLKSIEDWRWVEDEGRLTPRFRLKPATPASGAAKGGD
jgi:hypothetical protein